jgi:hypothetical protein
MLLDQGFFRARLELLSYAIQSIIDDGFYDLCEERFYYCYTFVTQLFEHNWQIFYNI